MDLGHGYDQLIHRVRAACDNGLKGLRNRHGRNHRIARFMRIGRMAALVYILRDVFVEEAKLSGWSCNATRKPGLGRYALGFCEPQGS